jgi:hypothetical protein
MSRDNAEWSRFTSKIVVNEESEETITMQPSPVIALINGLITIVVLSAISALGLMIANSVLVGAWPEFTEIAPGIGFFDAFHVSYIGWFVFIMKQTVVANVMK